ncbi:hypothetical protein [Brevibacillus borstelensis]|uniref:hypothetical protein n=1 Tax=Brevibacillus borstelensis TaxID=45462 RepID=UPI003CC91CAC
MLRQETFWSLLNFGRPTIERRQSRILNNTRYSPFDGIDMNRLFPGSTEGSPTLQLARALWEETRDDEYLIDLHICGVGGSTYTLEAPQGISRPARACQCARAADRHSDKRLPWRLFSCTKETSPPQASGGIY